MKNYLAAFALICGLVLPAGAQDAGDVDRLILLREGSTDSAEKSRLKTEIEKLELVVRGDQVQVVPGTFLSGEKSWIFTVISKAPELPWETSRMVDGKSYPDPDSAMAALKDALESQSLEGVITYKISSRDEGIYTCTVMTVRLEDRRTAQVLATTSPRESVAIFRAGSRQNPVTTASLEVQSTPEGAEVRLDGELKGTTPLKLDKIPPYRTQVELSWIQGGHLPWKTFLDPEVGKSYRIDYRSTSLEMTSISGGTFLMGNPGGFADEKPPVVRSVTSFLLSRNEVDQALWKEVMGANPSFHVGENLPVDSVTWIQALEFCNRLSLREGFVPVYQFLETGPAMREGADGYRLPSEAEWEYAAREGGGQPKDGEEGWYGGNSGSESHPAGSWKPNSFGLHDMAGNLWEWVWDEYLPYEKLPGPKSGSGEKVIRGGGWLSDPVSLRSTHRDKFPPQSSRITLGFRVARSGTLPAPEGIQP